MVGPRTRVTVTVWGQENAATAHSELLNERGRPTLASQEEQMHAASVKHLPYVPRLS